MAKPRSIGRFELFWWGSTLFWALGRLFAWRRVQNGLSSRLGEAAAADPNVAAVASGAQWAAVALVLAATALLWWLVARRASVIGKWLVVAIAAAGVVQALVLAFQLIGGANFHALSYPSFLASFALTVAAAAMLFRDDARAWFGEFDGVADEEGAA